MRLGTLAYYADFFISMALIAVLAAAELYQDSSQQVAQWSACFLAGFAMWTLLEYFVHRVLYHNVPYFEELHDAHHAEPNAFIGAPPVIGPVLILLMFFVPALAVSFAVASGVSAGVLAGYMAYMLVHHASHYWSASPRSWLYQARRHHSLHHYHHDSGNYGITTDFWDRVFGTTIERRSRGPRQKLPG